jgi:hypothetical protein
MMTDVGYSILRGIAAKQALTMNAKKRTRIACAVKGVDIQWVQLPPGDWVT